MQSLIRWTLMLGVEAVEVRDWWESHNHKKKSRHKNKQRQFGRIKKMNSLHTHTKANKCLHLDSNSRQAPFWATPIGLVIHSKVAAVRRKVALPLRQGCVCLKWIWVFLPGWTKEGWPSVRLALCSGSPCELSRLWWAWTILPQSGQTGSTLLLNEITMLCPQTSIGCRFHGDLTIHTSPNTAILFTGVGEVTKIKEHWLTKLVLQIDLYPEYHKALV